MEALAVIGAVGAGIALLASYINWRANRRLKRELNNAKLDHRNALGQLQKEREKRGKLGERWEGLNAEIGLMHERFKRIEDGQAAQAKLFDGMTKSHAKEIKRVSDLREDLDKQTTRHKLLCANDKAMTERLRAAETQLHQLGRKKVRRRHPVTGRFESVFEDELAAE